VQPRPDMIYGPWGHEQLRPMAARLAPQSPTATSATQELGIPKEKLVAFMKAVDFEGPTVEGDFISLEMFKNIVKEKVSLCHNYYVHSPANVYSIAWLP
jgi:hypothetical protein